MAYRQEETVAEIVERAGLLARPRVRQAPGGDSGLSTAIQAEQG